MSVVLDASSVIEAGLSEETSEAASALRSILPHLAEKFGFIAPGLLAWEVGNAVHHRDPARFGATLAERHRTQELLLSGIDLAPEARVDPEAAARLCERYGLTYYDATYLSLAAQQADGLLLTEDRGLLEAARSHLGPDRAHHALSAFHYVQDGIL